MRRLTGSLLLGVLALSLLGIAHADDTLVLKDGKDGTAGARFEGRVVEERENEIVFEHKAGSALVRTTFARADVSWIMVDAAKAPMTTDVHKRPGRQGTKPGTRSHEISSTTHIPHDFPELQAYKRNVIIVLDRSNAMTLGNRFELALDLVDSIVDHLPLHTGFGLYLFDSEMPKNVLGSNYVKRTDPKRRRVRSMIANLGEYAITGDADILSGLAPALRACPDAVYLISAGVPTDGEEDNAAFARALKRLHPKSRKFPVHVFGIRGGAPASGGGMMGRGGMGGGASDASDEAKDLTEIQLLATIAGTTNGLFREITADSLGIVQRRRGGGGKPPTSGKTSGGIGTGQSPGGPRGAGDAALMGAWRHSHGGGGGGNMGGNNNMNNNNNGGTTIIGGQ